MKTFAESNILSDTRQEYDSKVDLLCEWADAYYAKDQQVVRKRSGNAVLN